MKCRECKGEIIEWHTKGLSGKTCDCGMSHTIDTHPKDFQTRKLREFIVEAEQIEYPERLSEDNWLHLEIKYREMNLNWEKMWER